VYTPHNIHTADVLRRLYRFGRALPYIFRYTLYYYYYVCAASNLGMRVTRREATQPRNPSNRHNAIQFKTHNIIYRKLYGFKLID